MSWRTKRKIPLHIAEEFVDEGTDPPWCERRFIDEDIGNTRLSHFFVQHIGDMQVKEAQFCLTLSDRLCNPRCRCSLGPINNKNRVIAMAA